MPEYCICRSSDGDRFMIECDNCDEWFHGDCINLRQKDAKHIEKYFCKGCVAKNPSLEIVYKAKKADLKAAKPVKLKSTKPRQKVSKKSVSPTALPDVPPKRVERSVSRGAPERASIETSVVTSETDSADEEEWTAAIRAERHEVDNEDDKQVDGNSELSESESSKPVKKPRKKKTESEKGEKIRKSNAGRKPKARKDDDNTDKVKLNGKPRKEKKEKAPKVVSRSPPVPSEPIIATMPDIKNLPRIGRKSMNSLSSGYMPEIPEDNQDVGYPGFDRRFLKQCFGPGCRFAAAPDSKYCSPECGRALARKRLMEIMPKRLQQMGSPVYAATIKNQEEMEVIRKGLQDCKNVLESLMDRKKRLEEAITRGKESHAEPIDEVEEKDTDNAEVNCITCGMPQPFKDAIRHFERCYNKFENQTSYGSVIPTTSDIFCNFYNPKSKTYCRRLRVLCPEHVKEVVGEHEVCGFPLLDDDFRPTSKYCPVYKKSCSKHPSWERIKRAEIDLEILRTWIKMDDLAEQERVIMGAIRARGGIVQCMTNFSISHEPKSRGRASDFDTHDELVDVTG